jgi:hypothetical protein
MAQLNKSEVHFSCNGKRFSCWAITKQPSLEPSFLPSFLRRYDEEEKNVSKTFKE